MAVAGSQKSGRATSVASVGVGDCVAVAAGVGAADSVVAEFSLGALEQAVSVMPVSKSPASATRCRANRNRDETLVTVESTHP